MEHTATLDAIRTWLDELAEVEGQFAWLRDVTLEERASAARKPAAGDKTGEGGSAAPEVLLLGEAREQEAEELGLRVDSEPTLGGHFENAAFTPASDAGTVGVLTVRPG